MTCSARGGEKSETGTSTMPTPLLTLMMPASPRVRSPFSFCGCCLAKDLMHRTPSRRPLTRGGHTLFLLPSLPGSWPCLIFLPSFVPSANNASSPTHSPTFALRSISRTNSQPHTTLSLAAGYGCIYPRPFCPSSMPS